MLTFEAQKYIAASVFNSSSSRPKYVVIADNTTTDVTADKVKPGDATVVHQGNDYDAAVASANFWDERMNTHFVVNDVFKLSIVKDLVENDLDLPVGHKHYKEYKSLSASDTIIVMTDAAKKRVRSL